MNKKILKIVLNFILIILLMIILHNETNTLREFIIVAFISFSFLFFINIIFYFDKKKNFNFFIKILSYPWWGLIYITLINRVMTTQKSYFILFLLSFLWFIRDIFDNLGEKKKISNNKLIILSLYYIVLGYIVIKWLP